MSRPAVERATRRGVVERFLVWFKGAQRHPVAPCGGCGRPIGLATAHVLIDETPFHTACEPPATSKE